MRGAAEGKPIGEARNAPGRLSIVVVLVYLAFAVATFTQFRGGVDPAGSPLGYDFSLFYEAATLARTGQAAASYQDGALAAATKARFPGATVRLPWKYPPIFQLLLTPLAFLPYIPAWLVWSAGSYAGFVLLARRVAPPGWFGFLALAPGAAVNLLLGQNGLLSTVLIGGGTMLLPRRPLLAGLLFGAMAYKPHLAPLIPLALVAGRAWRTLAAAAATAAALAGGSLAAFGTGAWTAFFAKAAGAAAGIGANDPDWASGPTPFALAQQLGATMAGGAALQWTAAAITVAAVCFAWRRDTDPRRRAGALAVGVLLCTPYLRTYDLALLALPMAALAAESAALAIGLRTALIALAWLAPAILLFVPGVGPLVPPLLLILLLAMVAMTPAVPRTVPGGAIAR